MISWGLAFWIAYFVVLLFAAFGCWNWPAQRPVFGGWFVMMLLFGLLGMATLQAPVGGGGAELRPAPYGGR